MGGILMIYNAKHSRNNNKKTMRIRVFLLVFILISSLGLIGILCIYAEHFIALNTYPGESINFFGVVYDRTLIVDTLLLIGLATFFSALITMLLFIVYIRHGGW